MEAIVKETGLTTPPRRLIRFSNVSASHHNFTQGQTTIITLAAAAVAAPFPAAFLGQKAAGKGIKPSQSFLSRKHTHWKTRASL